MRDVISIKQGNTRPALRHRLDLGGADVAGLRAVFTMSQQDGRLIVDRAECQIDNGHAVYHWRAGETDIVGTMQGEFTVIYPDGGTQTDPDGDYLRINILRALSVVSAAAPVQAPFVQAQPSLMMQGDDLLVDAPTYGGTAPLDIVWSVRRGDEDVTHLVVGGRIADARGAQDVTYTATGRASNAAGTATAAPASLVVRAAGPQPIAGILDAPNVVVLGASHAASGFGRDGSQALNPIAQSMGYAGQFWSYAVPATTIPQAMEQYAASLGNPAIAATQGRNCYIIDQGGNDVAAYRSGTKTLAQIKSDLRTLIATITADGNKVVYVNQSKRIAPWGELTAADNIDAAGMKHFNETLFDPIVADLLPQQVDAQGRNRITAYNLAETYPAYLSDDGNHGYGGYLAVQVYGEAILANVMAAAKGQSPAATRKGKGFIWTFGNRLTKELGAINKMKIEGNSSFPHTLSGAQQPAGGPADADGNIRIVLAQAVTAGLLAGQGSGDGAFARIADTRFHDADVLANHGIYVQGSAVARLHLDGLTPGDKAQITIVASRATTANDRHAAITVTGTDSQTLDLDAGTKAVSNQIVFTPVVVPPTGRIEVTLAAAPGSTYGYINAMGIDFV